ncbi:hypothetical protein FA13DRAFT_452659 [Coprinellus micaceus]|uniref:Uncharacterized protein n=1 Tax=Coprinellus micaceus TaxID=71717 RepID=A0A4Y7TYE1_COPMI|nr:hypothetical protein FA13DRAFT_452659 [Coprinellus micaceus]
MATICPSPFTTTLHKSTSVLLSFHTSPFRKDIVHEGWGRPGTKYQGVYFRRALLNTIQRIDHLAHTLIPTHPPLKPHARMLLHFRFLIPLLPVDEDGLTPLHYYDSAIQVARNAEKELSEGEYEMGVRVGSEIEQTLQDCIAEMLAEQDSQSDSISRPRVSGEG